MEPFPYPQHTAIALVLAGAGQPMTTLEIGEALALMGYPRRRDTDALRDGLRQLRKHGLAESNGAHRFAVWRLTEAGKAWVAGAREIAGA